MIENLIKQKGRSMKKELKLLSGALLAVSLLSGCATKEETEVITETATVEQTQIMQKIDEMTKLQQLESDKIAYEKTLLMEEKNMLSKEKSRLITWSKKLKKEKEELETLKKALAAKNKKSMHSFYPSM